MNPLFSVLIATRNRIPYCKSIIETILSFEYENFELVVQDNSETLELKEYIEKRNLDKRLVYNYTPPPFSSVDNFNAVIGLAKGEYLCLIGDDDGINPEIFKVVEWAYQNKIDAITPSINAVYKWPDACSVFDEYKFDNGNLTIHSFTGEVKVFNPVFSIKKLMRQGGLGYLDLPFPKLYHGIVRRSILEKVKNKIGYYVGGLSPDIYITLTLSFFCNSIIRLDYPLTIPGACIKSAPLDERISTYNKLEDAPHFRNRGKYEWSAQVPRFYSSSNIWPESALAALKDLNKNDFIRNFNLTALTIALLKNHNDKKNVILEHYYMQNKANALFFQVVLKYWIGIAAIFYKLLHFLTRIKRRFFKIIKWAINNKRMWVPTKSYKNVENIYHATMLLKIHLEESNLSIQKVIEELQEKTKDNNNS